MTKKGIFIILLLISVMVMVVLYQTKEVSIVSHGRNVSSIKEDTTERPPSWYMDNSSNRFGVDHDKITPLNLGMTLPTDFSFNGSDWEIATLNALFIVQEAGSRKQEAGSRKYNIKNTGLTDYLDDGTKIRANSQTITLFDKSNKGHEIMPLSHGKKIQIFEIIGDDKKSLLLSSNDIPLVISLPELEKIKSYPELAGYELQHLSSFGSSSFLTVMKDNQWSLYRDFGGKLTLVSHLNGYANGLQTISENAVIVGNRNELSLFSDGILKPLITGFTHIMRIKKVGGDICVLDSDDPLLICFNKDELLDVNNNEPKHKIIAGNLFSYSSIVGVTKYIDSDDVFITTRPGRIWKKNLKTGLQEIIAGNGGNAWIDVNVPAIHSPIYYQTGIAFDGKYLYVAEQHGIYRLDTTDDIEKRRFELYAGDPKSYGDISDTDRMLARFLSIRDLSVTQNGEILVSDTGNHKIKKISHDGKVTTVAGGGINVSENKVGVNATSFSLKEPLSASSDSDGNIYIADSLDNVIIRVSPSGIVDKIIGDMMRIDYQGTGYGDHLFNTPSGVTVKNGNVFVTDSSSVKWVNIDLIDKKSCWQKVSGSWYYPMNPTIINSNLYINNTGSNDVTLSSWSSTDGECK
ncbi:TPA: hypothetical protein OUF90_003183 [Morganella morganii]|nr:hypothetical protein [Morganella morganii]HCU0902215.1 hypothetical protein [Morganella morganii]